MHLEPIAKRINNIAPANTIYIAFHNSELKSVTYNVVTNVMNIPRTAMKFEMELKKLHLSFKNSTWQSSNQIFNLSVVTVTNSWEAAS